MHSHSCIARLRARRLSRLQPSDARPETCWILGILLVLLVTSSAAARARTWRVPADAPTIQAGIDSAGVGDDVLVAPGTYAEHHITMKAGIWVHSEQGPGATTVETAAQGRGFDCADLQQLTVIEGFTVLNGRVDDLGGGIRCLRSRLAIRDCIISACSAAVGGGVYAEESELQISGCSVRNCYAGGIAGVAAYACTATISDCEISNNFGGGGGIMAEGPSITIRSCVIFANIGDWGCAGIACLNIPALAVRDCVIASNRQTTGNVTGLFVSGSSGVVAGCTVAQNVDVYGEGPAIHIYGNSIIEIERTIVALNRGRAVECEGWPQVRIRCCDLYGNTGGNGLCGDDLGGNFSADPLFCDAENGDYTLDGQSPCLPGNHPEGVDCGLIGALGQGCGATPVQGTTWGRIKAGYR